VSDPIRFEGVERSFGGHPVLCGLDLRVRAGEIYALLGRNGAGKTTALSVLLGFLRPHAGAATLLGIESTRLTPAERLRVGVVHEGAPMYRWMRVADTLAFEAGTRPNFDASYAHAALARLGVPTARRVAWLSRGQRAQLALVCAMAGDPEVLVLDDPAMGLDPVVRREFLDAMIDLLGRDGRAVLFSSHQLADVERLADRVGILHGGRLVCDARVDELQRRVQKRFVRGHLDVGRVRAVVGGVLGVRQRRDGFDLTLLDCDAAREAALRALTTTLGEPVPPTLEELFFDLTSGTELADVPRAGDVVAAGKESTT
jgi:ABC-2 type transport system ATP-binding protein